MTALELIKALIGNGEESLNRNVIADTDNISEAYSQMDIGAVVMRDGEYVLILGRNN